MNGIFGDRVKLEIRKKDLKVLNGKLIRLIGEFDNGKLKGIKVCGDFFIHPEESVLFLEEEILSGKTYRESVLSWYEKYSPKIIGFEIEDLICALECLN
ncbi:MAG TPA: hypothetical protein PLX15_00055 [Candidatus Woesearchaeota archaeon]|nr:hypothetical protein [Candidatus Woesearchaeota archaeon]